MFNINTHTQKWFYNKMIFYSIHYVWQEAKKKFNITRIFNWQDDKKITRNLQLTIRLSFTSKRRNNNLWLTRYVNNRPSLQLGFIISLLIDLHTSTLPKAKMPQIILFMLYSRQCWVLLILRKIVVYNTQHCSLRLTLDTNCP